MCDGGRVQVMRKSSISGHTLGLNPRTLEPFTLAVALTP